MRSNSVYSFVKSLLIRVVADRLILSDLYNGGHNQKNLSEADRFGIRDSMNQKPNR